MQCQMGERPFWVFLFVAFCISPFHNMKKNKMKFWRAPVFRLCVVFKVIKEYIYREKTPKPYGFTLCRSMSDSGVFRFIWRFALATQTLYTGFCAFSGTQTTANWHLTQPKTISYNCHHGGNYKKVNSPPNDRTNGFSDRSGHG